MILKEDSAHEKYFSYENYLFAMQERHRMKQLLAAQELLFPKLFASLQAAMRPLMARNRTGLEGGTGRRLNQIELVTEDDDDDDA